MYICYQKNMDYNKMMVHLSHLRYLRSQTPSSQQLTNNKRQKPNKKGLSRRSKKPLVVIIGGVESSQKNTSWAIVACPVDIFEAIDLKEKKSCSSCSLLYDYLSITYIHISGAKRTTKENGQSIIELLLQVKSIWTTIDKG